MTALDLGSCTSDQHRDPMVLQRWRGDRSTVSRSSSAEWRSHWRRARARQLGELRIDVESVLLGLAAGTSAAGPIGYVTRLGDASDALADQGTMHALARSGVHWERVEPDEELSGRTLLVGGGGGTLGALLDSDPAQIVILPHGARRATSLLARLRHGDLVLCRDERAWAEMRASGTPATLVLAHDMAFHLDPDRFMGDEWLADAATALLVDRLSADGWRLDQFARRPVMRFMRSGDRHGAVSEQTDVGIDIERVLSFGESDRASALAARGLLEGIRWCQAIETDLLHVAIGAALLGVPCRLLSGTYDGHESVHRHSLAGLGWVELVTG